MNGSKNKVQQFHARFGTIAVNVKLEDLSDADDKPDNQINHPIAELHTCYFWVYKVGDKYYRDEYVSPWVPKPRSPETYLTDDISNAQAFLKKPGPKTLPPKLHDNLFGGTWVRIKRILQEAEQQHD